MNCFCYSIFNIKMKKFFFIFLVFLTHKSFCQVDNNSRKIDLKSTKKSVVIPPVINKNPNSFAFKRIEKKKVKTNFFILMKVFESASENDFPLIFYLI